MLALLGLSKAKLVVGAAVLAVVGTIIGGLYLQNRSLHKDLLTAQENNGKLTVSVETQKATIRAVEANAKKWQEANAALLTRIEELSNVQREATKEARRLSEIFSKHNLTALSLAKPGLIERRINVGSRSALGVLERISAGDLGNADRVEGTGAAPAAPKP